MKSHARYSPGGRSITVSKPVRRVRPPDAVGTGISSESTAPFSSVFVKRPCMNLTYVQSIPVFCVGVSDEHVSKYTSIKHKIEHWSY